MISYLFIEYYKIGVDVLLVWNYVFWIYFILKMVYKGLGICLVNLKCFFLRYFGIKFILLWENDNMKG